MQGKSAACYLAFTLLQMLNTEWWTCMSCCSMLLELGLVIIKHAHNMAKLFVCTPSDTNCNIGLSVCVSAEHAVARLSLLDSGWPGPHICRGVPPRNHLAGDQPPGDLHHPDSCGFSRVYPVRFVHTLHDAPDAQQASGKCCHKKDEPARPGKAHCWVLCPRCFPLFCLLPSSGHLSFTNATPPPPPPPILLLCSVCCLHNCPNTVVLFDTVLNTQTKHHNVPSIPSIVWPSCCRSQTSAPEVFFSCFFWVTG